MDELTMKVLKQTCKREGWPYAAALADLGLFKQHSDNHYNNDMEVFNEWYEETLHQGAEWEAE